MKQLTILIFVSFISFFANAQAQNDLQKHEIKVLATVVNQSIKLRWAPTTSESWQALNKDGYRLERYTIKKNGQLLAKPIKVVLSTTALVPDALETWEELYDKNDFAAVLAQALYGEGFSVSNANTSPLMKIINQSKEQEQRYSFGLFAADMNFIAAKKAALAYVDTTISIGETYLYRVISQVATEQLNIKRGSVLVDTTLKKELPAPLELAAVSQDKSVLLTWNYELFKDLYIAYFVERSEDGITFKKINKQPLVNISEKETQVQRLTFVDTLSVNNKNYHYRVVGVTSFGEQSPPSKSKKASGYEPLKTYPKISDHYIDEKGVLQLRWDFEKKEEQNITHFTLKRAEKDDGKYSIVKDDIDKKLRSLAIKNLEPSNYFKLTAVGKREEQNTSFSVFVQTIDSIPPAITKGLEAKIDSTGVVKLHWKANVEKDLLGYRVFRANTATEEFIQLTKGPIKENSFTDKVVLKFKNKKVYYSVVAVDKRFNMAGYSKTLVVKKPDIIPPSSPVFKNYKLTEKGVFIEWIESSSDDVIQHQLYRKDVDVHFSDWQKVYTHTPKIGKPSFLDQNLLANHNYRYAIFAIDTSGLISEASTPVSISTKSSIKTTIVRSFTGLVDRELYQIILSWKLQTKVKDIQLYRAKNKELPVLLKQYSSVIEKVIDTNIHPGNVYRYSLKIKDEQGNHQVKKIEIVY